MSRDAGVQVRLDQLTSATAELATAWLGNPDINQWLSGEFRGQQVSARQLLLMASSPKNRLWVIAVDDSACGLVVLSQIDSHDRSARIWYLVGDYRQRGKGVAQRAVREAVRLGFAQLELESITASVMESNIGSAQVLLRAGFKPAGVFRRGLRFGDAFVDRQLFDIVRAEVEAEENLSASA